MDVNFWGTVNCTKYALPWLQKSRGSLVGISSVAGIHGLPGRTGYSASKYAMTGFLDTIRIENLKRGVHVMTACPGFTASNVRFSALTADGSQQGETPRNEATMMTAEELLWLGAANTEPQRDIVLCGATLVVDARAKRGEGAPQRWPNAVVADDATIAKVDSRWAEYGIGAFLESPSLRYKKLLLSDRAEW